MAEQPPRIEDDRPLNLREEWRSFDAPRRRWNRRCLVAAWLCLIGGLAGLTTAQVLYRGPFDHRIVLAIDIVSIALLVVGGVLLAFGPISWFWLKRTYANRNKLS